MSSPVAARLPPRTEADRARLLALIRERAYSRRRVVLSSGRESDFYVDLKRVTLDPEGLTLLGGLLAGEVLGWAPPVQGVGGMTLGADPIAAAVAIASWERGRPIPAFIVRKEPKQHGTAAWIEGRDNLPAGARVAVVEDVLTTGASALRAAERCRAEGMEVGGIVVVVDREEGGREAVEAAGHRLVALYTRREVVP